MNLEVLFNAADLTGNDTLRQIAISHADKTMTNHVRTDGALSPSIFVRSPFVTAFSQGHRSISLYMMARPAQSFLRAQCKGTPILAPGVVVRHGVSMALRTVRNRMTSAFPQQLFTGCTVYNRTQLVRYLHTARSMAGYFLDSAPLDGIIPWDFNAPPIPPRPADSSAAMIAANGLLLLAQQERSLIPANDSGASYYIDAAIKVSSTLRSAVIYPFNVFFRF